MTSAPRISHAPRAGEPSAVEAITARTDRLFQLSGGWYFSTRERVTLGPFPASERAESAVADFLAFITSAPPRVVKLFKGRQKPSAAGTVTA